MVEPSHKVAHPPRRSNRTITMAYRLEYIAARVLFGVFRIIGIDAASFIAGKFLRYVGPHVRKISDRGKRNLRLIYPHWPDQKIRKTLASVWENLGRTGAEFAHLDKLKSDDAIHELKTCIDWVKSQEDPADMPDYIPVLTKGRITLDVSKDLAALFTDAKPAIFVTAHFANWEVMSIICDYIDKPCAIVYRAANNPLMDEFIIRMRSKVVSHRHIPKGPDGARLFIDALKDKCSFALLMDQKFNDGVKVPFMGPLAMTAPAAARMALNYKLPLVPVCVSRKKGAHFQMTIHPQIPYQPTKDTATDIHHLTTLINKALERDIRAKPDQWLWLHRRWPEDVTNSIKV